MSTRWHAHWNCFSHRRQIAEIVRSQDGEACLTIALWVCLSVGLSVCSPVFMFPASLLCSVSFSVHHVLLLVQFFWSCKLHLMTVSTLLIGRFCIITNSAWYFPRKTSRQRLGRKLKSIRQSLTFHLRRHLDTAQTINTAYLDYGDKRRSNLLETPALPSEF